MNKYEKTKKKENDTFIQLSSLVEDKRFEEVCPVHTMKETVDKQIKSNKNICERRKKVDFVIHFFYLPIIDQDTHEHDAFHG